MTDAPHDVVRVPLTSGLLREERRDRYIQRFGAEDLRPDAGDLPAKKPVTSAATEPLYPVTEVSTKYSFVEQQGAA